MGRLYNREKLYNLRNPEPVDTGIMAGLGSSVMQMGQQFSGTMSGVGAGIEAKGKSMQSGVETPRSDWQTYAAYTSNPVGTLINDKVWGAWKKTELAKFLGKKTGEGMEIFGGGMEDLYKKNTEFYQKRVIPEYATMRDANGNIDPEKLVNPMNWLHQATGATGSMLPMIALSPLPGGVVAGGAVMGVAEKGDAFQTYTESLAKQKGISVDQLSPEDIKKADQYSDVYGVVSAVLESVVPAGIKKNLLADKVKTSILKRIVWNTPMAMIKTGFKEGGTEGMQRFAQNFIGKVSGLDTSTPISEGIIDEMIGGFAGGALFGISEGMKSGNIDPNVALNTENIPKKEEVPFEKDFKFEEPKKPKTVPNQEVFKNVVSSLSDEQSDILSAAVSKPINLDAVGSLSPEERQVLGIALQTAKTIPGANVENIESNIKAMENTGVEIPKSTFWEKPQVKAEKTPVEKPVPTSEKPASVKEVKKAVEEVKETPLQEGGKIDYIGKDTLTGKPVNMAKEIAKKPKYQKTGDTDFDTYSMEYYKRYEKEIKPQLLESAKKSFDEPGKVKVIDVDMSGSYKRGTPNPESDLDVKVYYEGTKPVDEFRDQMETLSDNIYGIHDVHFQKVEPKLSQPQGITPLQEGWKEKTLSQKELEKSIVEKIPEDVGVMIPEETSPEAQADWEENYAEDYGNIAEKMSVVQRELKTAKGENKITLQKQLENFNAKQVKAEEEFITKWKPKKKIKTSKKTNQSEIIKKATEANAKRLQKEGWVAPVKPFEETKKEKVLKLKYPETKKVLNDEFVEKNNVSPQLTVKLFEGKKITKVDFDKAGIQFPKQAILKMLKYSPEFKAKPILVMKDGRLRFEGKTNKFNIIPEAMGLNSKLISEGTKIEVNETELKSKEGGVIPIISKFINSIHEENVNTLLSEEQIQKEIEKIKKDLNPFLAKRAIFNIAFELVDKVGGKELSSAGLFNKYNRNIYISRSQKEGTMFESVAHEPGHQAWMYLSDAERNQARLYYEGKTLEEKRAIFGKNSKGQWRYDLYEKDYAGDKDMLVEETLVTEAAKDYLERRSQGDKSYSPNQIVAFIQKFIESIGKIVKSIYNNNFKKTFSIKEIFQEIYDNRSDFFQGRDYRSDDIATQIKYLSSILGERPELKIISVPLNKIIIDTEVFDAIRDIERGEKSHSYLPILLGKNSDGTYFIKDGRHRLVEQMDEGKTEFLATLDEKIYQQYAEEEYQIKESERDSLAKKVFVKEHTRAGIPVKSYSRVMRSILEESQPLTTEKGTLRTQEIFKEAWRKLYGEKAPVKLVDLLKREADKEIVEKGYKVSFQEGKKVQKKVSAEQRLDLREKNAAKIKEIRNQLKTMYKEKIASAKEIKSKVIEYVKANLPKKKWGEYLTKVRDAKTAKNLSTVIDSVDLKKSSYERSILVNSINRLTQNIDKLPIDIQRSILEITSNIELKNHTEKLLRRLRNTKEYLDKQSTDFGMPRRVLNELGILKRTPLKEIKTETLININNKLGQYDIVGKNIIKDKLAREARTKSEKLAELEKGSKNLDNIAPDRKLNPFEEEKITKMEKGRERLSQLQLNLMGVDRLFNRLDGRADYKGTNYRTFKEPVDDRWNEWQYNEDKYKMAFYKMLNELKMTEKNAKRIAIYAYNQQRGGRTKLIEDHKMTPEQIDSVKLDEKEMAVYKWMRTQLDAIHESLTKTMAEENNVILGKVEKYFPMMTNYSVTKPLLEEFVGENRFKAVPFGNIKERKEYAHQTLQMDAFQVFDSYVGKSTYFMAMNKTIKELSDLASSEKYREAVGDNAQRSVLTWLDVLARKGGAIAKESKWLDKVNDLNNKLSIVILGLRITTIAKQPLALLDGAAEIGAYAFKGVNLVIDPKWREFMNENSSELRNRAGGDPAFEELAHDKTLAKVQDKAMAPIKFLDRYTAGAVWAGAYTKKMDELGLPVDLKKPNTDALKYANLVVRKTQSSGTFKDLPLAMTGKYRTASKLIFKFQNFVLNRWSYISEDLPDHIKNNKKVAAQQITFLAISMMLEAGVSGLYYGLTKGDDDDKESKLSIMVRSILSSTIQTVPFLGQLISSLNYGTNPVPLIAAGDKFLESLRIVGTGKKIETKTKHAIRVMSIALGLWKGIPTEQARQLLEMMLFPSGSSKLNY